MCTCACVRVHARVCALRCSVPSDCSPPGPSVHGIFQARMLEQAAISSSVTVCRDPLEGHDSALKSVWSVSVCSANNVSKRVHTYWFLIQWLCQDEPLDTELLGGEAWSGASLWAGRAEPHRAASWTPHLRWYCRCPLPLLLAPEGSSFCFQAAVTFWEPWAPTILQRTVRMQPLWTTAPFYHLTAPKVRLFLLLRCVRVFCFLVLFFSK